MEISAYIGHYIIRFKGGIKTKKDPALSYANIGWGWGAECPMALDGPGLRGNMDKLESESGTIMAKA